ncbi:MAG TPA: hypothetical protein ENI20_02765 [Bacteroides sp.]|nr:hypothetical protein [Bacteroides sp.]
MNPILYFRKLLKPMNMKYLKIILFAFIILGSCQKDDEFNEQFDFMYGDWHVVSIYTWSLPPEGSFEILRLSYPNQYSILVQNLSVDVGKFDIGVESDEKLNLVFNSKSNSDNFYPPSGFHNTDLKVIVHRNDSISMYNLITDNGHFAASLIKK